ncbi:motility associated factor glycosyltransferase family protein [Campylobacter fetus]|uniref:motility associated factor glycosyltransferase family protein n=1 Tax=Campylobacter fetus TaxID=196 RepID=UPI0005090224|nr:6-hydroxymethylpterin diphosphokinase MptE-like protein [Campylobacter fetus]AIR79498.1 motility accessory factor [Campylobacter fetus subsp. fetus 04/554]EAJ5694114.1 DUF115 domain-containing protein [Campylobacter fetus]EAJ5704917.1 DUF115 domain-containing protein [Campylobacter fetus]EAJ9257526.1 motility associated factor glycosyltransferase family protein [Campylobacter fetus]EAK0815744.1 DUF115 domain-containing protein [Campylobacter fetus]
MKDKELNQDEKQFLKLNEELGLQIAQRKEITIFDRNIAAIMTYSWRLAKMLFDLKENKKFGVFMGKDPLDINIINLETKKYLYESPAKEVEEKIISFEEEYSRHKALYFYGIGNGIFIKSLLSNESHSRIIVFEPELEILYIALSLIDFSVDIYNERLVILYPDLVRFIELYTISLFPDVMISSRLYNMHVVNDFYNQKEYQAGMVDINQKILKAIKQVFLEAGNDSKDTLIGIKHSTKNLPIVFDSYPIERVFKKRKNAVKNAVIVATGPSLFKQLKTLKKIAPYVTIISIDASYPILKKHGIKPDYVSSIERVELTSKFFKDPVSEFDDGILFVTASLTHEKTIENLKDRQTSYVLRPLHYERGFNDNEFGYIGGGPSAAHMAFDIALKLEHENIILLGQDLAFGDDGTSHSKGHIFKKTEIDPSQTNVELAPKYGGIGEIATTTIWNLFRNYFEHYIQSTSQAAKFTVYNCTEGGARIQGTIEKPFKEIADLILDKPIKKRFIPIAKINQASKERHLNKARKHILKIIKYGENLQKKCEKLFLKIAKEVEKAKKLKAKNQADKINYTKMQNLSFALDDLKTNLNDEIFLSTFYGCCGQVLLHQELELAVIAARKIDTEEEKKDKLFEWISSQSYWLFSLAGNINLELEEIKKSAKEWL